MVKIRVSRANPDGLDPLFAVYRQLKRIYEASTWAADICTCDEGSPCPCEDYILLPGTGEAVDANDWNELDALEEWLAKEVARQGIPGGAVE